MDHLLRINLPRIFALRFDRSKLATVDALVEFVHTRSSYIAQTSLHGYLKTRMGTSFTTWFEDEAFSASIRIASVKLFLSCLGDLTVFAVATAARQASLGNADLEALARHCFREAAVTGLVGHPEKDALEDVFEAFDQRIRFEDWQDAAEGRRAFERSENDLIRLAPVIDEYRELDREIVTNSIRFRWRDAREQARKRIDGNALGLDWRTRVGSVDQVVTPEQ